MIGELSFGGSYCGRAKAEITARTDAPRQALEVLKQPSFAALLPRIPLLLPMTQWVLTNQWEWGALSLTVTSTQAHLELSLLGFRLGGHLAARLEW